MSIREYAIVWSLHDESRHELYRKNCYETFIDETFYRYFADSSHILLWNKIWSLAIDLSLKINISFNMIWFITQAMISI